MYIGPLCRCLLDIIQLYVYNNSDIPSTGIQWYFNDVPYLNYTVVSPTGIPSSTGIPSPTGTLGPTGTPSHAGTPSPASTTSQSTSSGSHSDQVWKTAVACVVSVLGGIVLLVFLVRIIRRRRRLETLPAIGPK